MRILVAVSGATLLLLAWTNAALTADFRLLQIDGYLVKWGQPRLGTGATVTYALADRVYRFADARNCKILTPPDLRSARGRIATSDLVRELDQAFAAWELVVDVTFRRVDTPASADVIVGAQGAPRGRAFANVMPAETLASAWQRDVELGFGPIPSRPSLQERQKPARKVSSIRKAQVCLNPEQLWKIGYDGDTEVYDLRYTFMHEIGHVLGLNHSGPSGTLMSFRYEEQFRGLQTADIAGGVTLYGDRSRTANVLAEPGRSGKEAE